MSESAPAEPHEPGAWHRVATFVAAHRRVLAPIAVGTAVRVVWVAATAGEPALDRISDPVVYRLAAEKAAHLDFGQAPEWPWGIDGPTSFLSVGYPNLIGAISWATGRLVSVLAVAMIVNVVAGALLVWGVARLAESVGHRHASAALVAPWACALYPDLVTASALVMTEVVGVCALVWLAVAVLRQPVRWWSVGVLLSTAVWLRPSLQLLVIVVPILVWWLADVRTALTGAVAALLLLAPLAYHSSVTVGVPVFSSSTWVNICDGAAPDPGTPTGTFLAATRCRFPGGEVRSEREWSAHARSVAVDAISDDPVGWVAAVPQRLRHALGGGWGVEVANTWSGHLGASALTDLVRDVSRWTFWVVLLAGAGGAASAWRDRTVRVAAALAAVSLAGVAVSFGQPRYGLPLVVLVCLPGLGVIVDRLLARTAAA